MPYLRGPAGEGLAERGAQVNRGLVVALILASIALLLNLRGRKAPGVVAPQDSTALRDLRDRIKRDSIRHDSEMRAERRRTDSTLRAIRTAPRHRTPAIVASVIRPTPPDTTAQDVEPIDTADLPEMLRECGDSLASIRPERDSLRRVDSLAGFRLQERTEALRLCEARPAPVVEPVSRAAWAGAGALAAVVSVLSIIIITR